MATEIDPVWAWSQYTPDGERPWDRRMAAHLYRRAGFGATDAELHQAVQSSPISTVDRLLDTSVESRQFRVEIDELAKACLATGNPRSLSAWWLYRMLTTPAQLTEKTTLFWHGHFATSAAKVDDSALMFAQHQTLRQLAVGDFAKLVQRISSDPAMLLYLDSDTNRKSHPNENYARELMELFCLGEGNYTEHDIRELARCFTGWEVKRKKFRFNRFHHDSGEKTVLGESGKFGGDDGARIVIQQPAAPRFIVKKLIRFFLFDEPEASPDLIEPLAQLLRESEMQVEPVMRRMLASNLFFSSWSFGRKIRSPVELAVGFLRVLEGSTDAYELAGETNRLGQGLFYPPNVKGWDGGRDWINSSTLLGRANLIRQLIENKKTRFGGEQLGQFFKKKGLRDQQQTVDWLVESLFAVPIPDEARRRVEMLVKGDQGKEKETLTDAVVALCTLPEFQLA
jgi:uncharacterized protein (DUF1800 family)